MVHNEILYEFDSFALQSITKTSNTWQRIEINLKKNQHILLPLMVSKIRDDQLEKF